MKKLLLIFSLIFIQYSFGQQNFLKKSELRDSLDAYNFQNDGLNDSLALIRGEISDTSATLRQVIIDTASAIRTDIGGLNTAYVDSVANLKLDKTAFTDSVLANNLINRQELDDTSQSIHQAIIDSSGAIRSYTDLKLDKSALKDSINSRNLVYESELDDSILSVNSNLADSMSQMLTVDQFIDTLEIKEIDSLHVNRIVGIADGGNIPIFDMRYPTGGGGYYNGVILGYKSTITAQRHDYLALTYPFYDGGQSPGIVKIGDSKTRAFILAANGTGAGRISLGDSASSIVPLGMIFSSNNVERQRISGTGIVSFTSDTVKNTGVFRNTGFVNSVAGYLHNGTNINTIYAPLASPTFTGTATAPTFNATTAYNLGGTSINTTGTLTNVAYKGQDNNFAAGQSITGNSSIIGTLTLSSDLIFNNSTNIKLNTVHGNDNKALRMSGGGSVGNTRGAIIILGGNQEGSYPGKVFIATGDINGASINLAYRGTTRILIDDANDTDVTGNIIASGTVTSAQFKLSALNTAPASATATGTTGEIRIVDGFIYVCVSTNVWKRCPIEGW